ncbi:MAG: 3-oxoacyl-ACP synthase, partial [Nocardiaceae bacterium]|nr:3-oxoacyl-ACP synthase [Nocardiaceae bacterium]
MTIDDTAGNGRTSKERSQFGVDRTPVRSAAQGPLVDRLRAGEPYALAFGGQGAPWLSALAELTRDSGLEPTLTELVNEAAAILEPVAQDLLVVRPVGFDPIAWILEQELADDEDAANAAGPSAAALTSAAVSMPGVFLTQVAAMRALQQQGLDPAVTAPVATIGHSQGLIAASAVAGAGAADGALLATAQLIGAAAGLVGRRRGILATADRSPMLAVSNVDPERLAAIVAELAEGVDENRAAVMAIRNGRRRVVLSGPPAQLARVQQRCEQIAAEETRARDAKSRGGAVFSPVFESLSVEVGFHHPALNEAVDTVCGWATRCGLDADQVRVLAQGVLVDPVDWVEEVEGAISAGAAWILDLGPGDLLTRMTSTGLRGQGVGIVAASTRAGHRNLLTPGAAPEVPRAWSEFAPKAVALPGGRVAVETAFTRLTGRSPILLAGMTPTTVDPAIVAAAANAGHWAELAGGGQVTEQIFADHVE